MVVIFWQATRSLAQEASWILQKCTRQIYRFLTILMALVKRFDDVCKVATVFFAMIT